MPTDLQTKVSFALDENRTLILGSQVLLGFGYEAFFERGFHRLLPFNQQIQIANLFLILISTIILIAPTCFHRVLGADHLTENLLSYTSVMVEWALYPLALALGLSIFCSLESLGNPILGVIFGGSTTFAGIILWSLGPYFLRLTKKERAGKHVKYSTPLETRLRHVLTETRVMLPGAQALLGFQLITFYMDDYIQMAVQLKWIHVISLLFITVAVVLLIAPAAFHRIADKGEATERSYRFASAMVLASSIPLGIGLVGEFYLILAKAVSSAIAVAGSVLVASLCLGLWFGYALYVRACENPTPKETRHE